jgi:hypothetical protein
MEKTERRVMVGGLELRTEPDKTPQLVGYAAKFDVWSDDLGGFREKIAPGAFDRALREGHDVRALVNHEPSLILGRSTAKTLRLSIDQVGLRMELDLPQTQVGRDIATSVERGDIDQMSFGFRTEPGGSVWDLDADPAERVITEIAELFDVSVVTFPAYPQTDVALRSLDEARASVAVPGPDELPAENIRLRRRLTGLV